MKKILFVCTGNTCRSSMAEGLLKSLLEKEGLDTKYQVQSAGTSVFMSRPASHNAVLALESLGIDLTRHVSRQVSEEMLQEADLILTMTASHKNYLLQIKPDAAHKIYTLKEYSTSSRGSDVTDPFGGDLDIYVLCRDDIRACVLPLIEKIKNNKL